MIEFEVKAPVPPGAVAGLRARLGSPAAVEEHADLYYAHPQRSFARTDEALRLSRRGDRIEFTYKDEVTDPVEKVKAFIEMAYGQGRADDFTVAPEGDKVDITLPDSCKYDQRWFVAKYRLVSDLRTFAGYNTTRFIEEYLTEQPKADAEASGEETPKETHTHADGTVHEGPAH